ncbi:DinB family protein [Glutamicibacter sp.]|uniref:DinB family protein n=1 Tax=Glutamicibacter sp. TaxID=1931995 RepID=UPI003D6C6D2F
MDQVREQIAASYRHDATALGGYLSAADFNALKNRSEGTRWTNEQLLFHMVFGYMVVRALIPLVHLLIKCPPWISSAFCKLLNFGTPLFHLVNYLGSCAAATVFNHRRVQRRLERTQAALLSRLGTEQTAALQRCADFPSRWDPFFHEQMSLAQVYAYPSEHFAFHCQQLSLPRK